MDASPWASSPRVARVMRGNRSRDTKPELAVRKLLHAHGLRYRVNFRPLPGLRRTADIVFTRQRIAIFIDGCYWHGCREHYVASKSHPTYWGPKIAANIARDAETTRILSDAGWTVLRYWSHTHPKDVAVSVEAHVADHSSSPGLRSELS